MKNFYLLLIVILLVVGGFFVGRYVFDISSFVQEENVVADKEIKYSDQGLPVDTQVSWRKWVIDNDQDILDPNKWDKDANPIYNIGSVTSGKYDGYKILYAPYTNFMAYSYGYFLQKGSDLVFVENPNINGEKNDPEFSISENIKSYPDEYLFKNNLSMRFDKDFHFEILSKTPNKIIDPDTGNSFVFAGGGRSFDISNENDSDKSELTPFFKNDYLGQIYSEIYNPNKKYTGAVFARRADGVKIAYILELPFVNGFIKEYGVSYQDVELMVDFNDKTKLKGFYSAADRSGCGTSNYLSIIRDLNVNSGELLVIGKTSDGRDVYVLNDYSNAIYQKLFDESYKDPEYPLTLSQFVDDIISSKGLLFVQDDYGRLIKFTSSSYGPAVECGKPVIYLYPEKETEINVKVSPKGGFTKTEPEYPLGGWNVIAKPNGEIKYKLDNQIYPYLFWEGSGGLYSIPEKGWSVSRENVSDFLSEKLSAFGLNEKEISDFKEFWLPRMQDKSHYFVTFMGNETMNSIAPLSITPKPDTVIRVLMDFKGLDAPIKVDGFEIKTTERKGFTVVEWGGVIN
jgi:hypothetical protein